MTVPDGFTVTAFAGEPDIRQPIAMTIDDRGRLWVAIVSDERILVLAVLDLPGCALAAI